MFLTLFPIISPIAFILIVTVLGFVTPGYSHINYTISRLAIEKYGWIQSLNFFQLAVAFSTLGSTISSEFKASSRLALRLIFSLTSLFLVVAGLFPTDPIENIPLRFSLYTPVGLIHAGSVVLFVLVSPFGIHRLSAIMAGEPKYREYAMMTKTVGYLVFAGSILWFACFALGIGLEYRGITQKILIAVILLWFTVMALISRKNSRIR